MSKVPLRTDLLMRAFCYEVCMALSEVQANLYNQLDAVMLTEPLYREFVQLAVHIQVNDRPNLPRLAQAFLAFRPALAELAHYFHLFAISEAGMDPAVMLPFHERFSALVVKLDQLVTTATAH